LIENFEFPNLN